MGDNMDKIGIAIGSIIIGASCIIGANILKGSNLLDSNFYVPSSHVSFPSNLELEQKDVLQLYEAAKYLGMEFQELEFAIETNRFKDLPYVKLGDHYVFSKKLIELWVEEAAKNRVKY